jgi:(5-formylfuran-3-yl)methyl phosphate synthase
MPLLVSVRSAEEAAAALAGGAEIIDAKEPARGSLGAVDPEVLRAIAARTPPGVPLSVALGDLTEEAAVRDAVRAVRLPPRGAPVYLKLGFAGVSQVQNVEGLLRAAAEAALGMRLVAVAYADHRAAESVAPREVLAGAQAAGVHGLLVDTWGKEGRGLLDFISVEELDDLRCRCRAAGFLFALAGSLHGATLARVAALADVVGVRGAACGGGRSGMVEAERVATLRRLTHAGDRALLAG